MNRLLLSALASRGTALSFVFVRMYGLITAVDFPPGGLRFDAVEDTSAAAVVDDEASAAASTSAGHDDVATDGAAVVAPPAANAEASAADEGPSIFALLFSLAATAATESGDFETVMIDCFGIVYCFCRCRQSAVGIVHRPSSFLLKKTKK